MYTRQRHAIAATLFTAFATLTTPTISRAEPQTDDTTTSLPSPTTGYRASMTLTTPEISAHGRVFVDHQKERREIVLNGVQQTLIIRRDKNVMWLLMPQHKHIMELPLTEHANVLATGASAHGTVLLKPMGQTAKSDTIDGIRTRAYAFRALPASAPHQLTVRAEAGITTGTLWLTADNIVVRRESQSTLPDGKVIPVTYALQAIKTGPQTTDLFEIPADYTRIVVPPAK